MNKPTTLRRAVIALAALVLLASVAPAQTAAQKPFLGSWRGQISVMGQTLEIRLAFKLDEAKQIAGTFDSISQGAAGLGLTDIQIDAKTIAFALDPALVPGNALFKGTLDAAANKLAGDFSQSGVTGTFSVEREKPGK